MITILVFALGLLIGSFLNVCISRIPKRESIVFPHSHCPGCGRNLKAAELVPVLSFLVQRGKCRGCGGKIAWRYPLVELLTGVIFIVLYTRYAGIDFLLYAIFFSLMVIVFFIDFDHQIIPNRLILILLSYVLVWQITRPVVPWGEALLGGILGGCVFLILALISKGGMGGGDIKLVAVLGLLFGWRYILILMFLSFILGGVTGALLLAAGIKKRKDGIPFGPFLVLASFIVSAWGENILFWYLRLSGW